LNRQYVSIPLTDFAHIWYMSALWSLKAAKLCKVTSGQIQDGGRSLNLTYINRNNSAWIVHFRSYLKRNMIT